VVLLEIVVRSLISKTSGSFHCPFENSQSCCPQMPNFCFSSMDGSFATWPNVSAPSAASERCRFLAMPDNSCTGRSLRKSFSSVTALPFALRMGKINSQASLEQKSRRTAQRPEFS
jgi:hypothetical protein